MGWRGIGYDVDELSLAHAKASNSAAVEQGLYRLKAGDWLQADEAPRVDLILAGMVLEHLDDSARSVFLEVCGRHLTSNGRCIFLVPGSPRDWGIEDEIAGHYRRYTREELSGFIESMGWIVHDVAGLNYPLSNLMLPISNWLTRRSEAYKRDFSMTERTRLSGRRIVPGKTHLPDSMSLLVNRWTMYPFHWLQKLFRDADRALVLYIECEPRRSAG
jgi:SAM-dependent methyltransferase